MSTRGLVGAETESGIKAVYVHSDNYPDGQWGKIETLRRLVAAHGVSKVLATLLETPAGWSSFDGEPGDELSAGHTDGRFELVPGFGVRYTLDEIDMGGLGKMTQGNTEYDGPGSPINWDIEYVYVIAADGTTLRWAEGAEDWSKLVWNEVAL